MMVAVYYVDTMVSIKSLFYYRGPGDPALTKAEEDGAAKATVLFGVIFAAWAVIPVYGVGGVTLGWPLVAAAIAQGAASWTANAAYRRRVGSRSRPDFTKILQRRLAFVFGRWICAVWMGLLWPVVVVLMYAAITVYYEMSYDDAGAV